MKALSPFLIAVQFLTRFPVPAPSVTDRRAVGRSLLYYPVVGLLFGITLAGLNALLVDAPDMLRAVLVLAVWVLLTGALHLDGLADSADAWIGGIGDRKRTLAIMKDPYCGPAAVVALVVVLLAKFAALHEVDPSNWIALAVIPMLARASIPLLFLTTPYVRPGGLGAALSARCPRIPAALVVVIAAIAALALSRTRGVWLLLTAAVIYLVLRAMMRNRIGGTTGDTAGALIEISEVAMLVTIVLLPD